MTENERILTDALEHAFQTIRIWHGMGMDEGAEQRAWALYCKSPEMKRILDAFKVTHDA